MVRLPGNLPMPDGMSPLFNSLLSSSQNKNETSSFSSNNSHPLPEMPVEILNARLAKFNAIGSVCNLLLEKTQMYRRNPWMGELLSGVSPEFRSGVGYVEPLPDSLTHGEGLQRIYYDRKAHEEIFLMVAKQSLQNDGADKRLQEMAERLIDLHESEEIDVRDECAKMRADLGYIPGWVEGNSNHGSNE